MSDANTRVSAETITAAPTPPERPVVGSNSSSGQHQYLDGFLNPENAEKAADATAQAASQEVEGETLDDKLLAALRSIFDPEIPVNIFDLGLIYDCEIDEENKVYVTMTLTTPHCPVAETMPGEVEGRLAAIEGVQDVTVNLVWEPAWTPERMSDEAKLELGFL